MVYWKEQHELLGGKIVVYKRGDNDARFHARFRLDGVRDYVRKSTKTSDLDEAKSKALELYHEYQWKHGRGLTTNSKKFKDVANEWLAALSKQAELETDVLNRTRLAKKHKDYSGFCNRYLIKYFGKKAINQITEKDVSQYRDWRRLYWSVGDGKDIAEVSYKREGKTVVRRRNSHDGRLSASSQNKENTVLRQIFEFARVNGYVSANEIVTVKNVKSEGNKRGYFDRRDYQTLLSNSYWRIQKAGNLRVAHDRANLHNFLVISANSGCRVGELTNVRWKDVDWDFGDVDGNRHLALSVQGKTGKRTVITQGGFAGDSEEATGAVKQFEDLRARQAINAERNNWRIEDDTFVFTSTFGKQVGSFQNGFNALLDAAKLEYDKDGLKRTLYSLRATYASFRIQYGEVSLWDLKDNMGTSIEMIQRHYGRAQDQERAARVTRNKRSQMRSRK
jgi:integrase